MKISYETYFCSLIDFFLTAKDGLEALEQLKVNGVTLIVSDWMMPRMDGIEFCKAVRTNQLTSHIPFILLTAKTDVNSKIEGMPQRIDSGSTFEESGNFVIRK